MLNCRHYVGAAAAVLPFLHADTLTPGFPTDNEAKSNSTVTKINPNLFFLHDEYTFLLFPWLQGFPVINTTTLA